MECFWFLLFIINQCSFSRNVHYIDRDGKEMYMTVTNYPKEMSKKKMQLLLYFKRYMSEHLVKAGGDSTIGNGDVVSRPPHLNAWFRTNCAVIMHLTNGSVQVSRKKSSFRFNTCNLTLLSHFNGRSTFRTTKRLSYVH